ncbi:MAG: carbohydrate-binding family 9-like protein [Planctomycetota bacterium]
MNNSFFRRNGTMGMFWEVVDRRSWMMVVGVVTLLGALSGCRLAEGSDKDQRAVPTEEDKEMVERVADMAEEHRDTVGAEPFNHLRGNQQMQMAKEKILNEESMVPDLLKRARKYFESRIEMGRLAERWPEPDVYEIVKTDTPINLDGRLDDEAWESAETAEISFPNNTLEPEEEPVGTARLLWDEEYLYAGFDVPDQDVQAPELERDGHVYNYDCVELFFMGDPRFKQYRELNVSPSGAVFDMLGFWHPRKWGGDNRSEEDIKGLEIAYEVEGELNDSDKPNDGYTVEIAIPWEEVPNRGCAPATGETIYGLMAISDLDSPEEGRQHVFASNLPILGWFHNIRCYGPMELVERD